MSQSMQQGSRAGTVLQVLPDAWENDAQMETLKIVACSICRAVYVPAGAEVVRNSLPALEEAFLEVCRPCFHCQRPACPQCWNPVHHVCAACSEEARLPFRSPIPSLEGLVFLSHSAVQAKQASRLAFTCQRNGRFYTPEPAQVRAEEPGEDAQAPTPAVSAAVISNAQPARSTDSTSSTPSAVYPSWLQEVLGQNVAAPVVPAVSARAGEARPVYAPLEPQESQASWSPVYPHPQMMPALPSFVPPIAQAPAAPSTPSAENKSAATQPQENNAQEEEFSVFERIENVLIVITSILLLTVVLMIVLSISFAPVNTFFLSYLHIDIRTEIAYLLQLR